MTFIVRILFSGLIAFVPRPDGKELTVLLLHAPASYHVSDGTLLAHHMPLLVVRGEGCGGDCTPADGTAANFLFADQSAQQAAMSLSSVLGHGSAWPLDGSDIEIDAGVAPPLVLRRGRNGSEPVPQTAQARQDFDWVANFSKINPDGGGLSPKMLAQSPPPVIAARLHLRGGSVFTYRLVRVGRNVKPIHFKTLGAGATEVPYTQAVANWVAAEIEITGPAVTVVEKRFAGKAKRSMTLKRPANGVLEMAVLNLPRLAPPPPGAVPASEPGKHFELYYELVNKPPARNARPIPHAGQQNDPEGDWLDLHPEDSVLLRKLRLDIGRGPYDQVLCPMVQYP